MGAVPDVLRRLEGTNADGVRVSIEPAAHSQGEMTRAAKAAFRTAQELGLPTVLMAGPDKDSSHLVVRFTEEDLATFDTGAAETALTTKLGVPVQIIVGQEILHE